MSVAEHFERAARDYGALRGRWPLGALREQEQRALHDLVRPRPGELVLDAGCGDGETLAWLRDEGARAVGVDVTPAMAAHCRRRGFAVAIQDMQRLGVQSRFDWVLCVGSLEFVLDPAATIAGFASCLRPGGRLGLLYPRRHLLGWVYAAYHGLHGVRIHLFSRPQIEAYMRGAGLRPLPDWRDGALSSMCVAERPAERAGGGTLEGTAG